MLNVIGYLKNRSRAWQDYYHLKRMPDRLLEDMGLERRDLDKVLKNKVVR